MRFTKVLLVLLLSGFIFYPAVKAHAFTNEILQGDSSKVKSKPVAVPASKSKSTVNKKSDDYPMTVDFSKKTVRLNLFGNTVDLDFKNKNMELNKDKDKKPDDDWFNFF